MQQSVILSAEQLITYNQMMGGFIPQAYEESPVQGQKRKGESTTMKGGHGLKPACRYRGITHHARTSRFESHLWSEGSQLYLGGFYDGHQAALCFDLAAIRYRGADALTNFSKKYYQQELASMDQLSKEEVVMHLRDQSKAMNKVVVTAKEGITMEAWELELSTFIASDKQHFGVYSSENDAARAHDRAMVGRFGADAAPLLNFKLVDYIDMLDQRQIALACHQGLLPLTLPLSFKPSPVPEALVYLAPRHVDTSNDEEHADYAVPRRSSVTPRSVLDFEQNTATAGVKRTADVAGDDAVGSKRPRVA